MPWPLGAIKCSADVLSQIFYAVFQAVVENSMPLFHPTDWASFLRTEIISQNSLKKNDTAQVKTHPHHEQPDLDILHYLLLRWPQLQHHIFCVNRWLHRGDSALQLLKLCFFRPNQPEHVNVRRHKTARQGQRKQGFKLINNLTTIGMHPHFPFLHDLQRS